ncbi:MULTISPECIES: 5-carboxymethyl-2-hydroxymuconate isomerase [unclassified Limnohabitans]|jgi:5-carboxymethyl-2-hydroxymuconate isomerase|uniref:5-carboxymethyl-2-hydroxymuconate isomerase n=1 Tax=unclassified Limnohabitans TaxID=2626134 RepID=UPI000CF2B6CC|nr:MULTISPECIES: 5-carboxymethyl-2-hydroxymuconate isomerase [unclassified Limnohabitans]PQA85022.1 5-carboxymethyl-2-hydroxymuconate isomerase [Limnohabitans sp. TS-CS-82]BDU54375.1 5-carboxymethyl-2-hydroxymuconate isomerase [Limnohabitans sp. TEGF004]
MPHLIIQYTPQLDAETNMAELCQTLSNTMLSAKHPDGKAVFPIGATRVLAFATTHAVIADGSGDYAYVYLNFRIAKGRTPEMIEQVGQSLLAATQAHFADVFAERPIGITLQIDEGHEVFNAVHNNLHPLFNKP